MSSYRTIANTETSAYRKWNMSLDNHGQGNVYSQPIDQQQSEMTLFSSPRIIFRTISIGTLSGIFFTLQPYFSKCTGSN